MAQLSRFKMSQERLDALKDELYYLETNKIRTKKTIGARISSAPYFPIKLRIGKPYLPLLERCAPLRKILS